MEPQGTSVPFLPLRREGDLRKIADLEQRVQLLDEAIARVQQTESRLQASEASFRRMTEDCGGLLRAVATVEQLESLKDRLNQLVEDSSRRMGEFEDGVNREWESLREAFEQPLRDFQEQALAIQRTSLEAAQSAAVCRQIAEESLAALTARGPQGSNLPAGQASVSEPWSLDDVTRVHRDVRSAQQRRAGHAIAEDDGGTIDVESTDRASTARNKLIGFSALGLVLLLAGIAVVWYSLQMRERVVFLDSRVREATTRMADAEKQTFEARQLAQQQILQAQRTARYAQVVAELVAAPDLRRIDLVGRAPAPAASAQALWSRTRGFHLTASQLPPVPQGKVYQVWALTRGEFASLGVFETNADGRGDLLVDHTLTLPRVTALIVSLEDSAGVGQPTGTIYLGPRPPLEE